MSDDYLKNGTGEEKPSEIDIESLLRNEKESTLYDGFHDDIKQTEQSLESELQSLYDDIMSSGPATIVPKPISVIASEKPEEKKEKAPEAPQNAGKQEWGFDYDDLEAEEEKAENGGEEAVLLSSEQLNGKKDDIFSLISSLKSDTEKETGFDDILSEIETNSGIVSVAPSGISPELPADIDLLTAEENEEPAPKPEAFKVELSPEEEYVISDPYDEEPASAAAKPAKKAEKKKQDSGKPEKKKDNSSAEKIRKAVLAVSIVVIIISSGILINTYFIQPLLFKRQSQEIIDVLDENNTGVVEAPAGDAESKYPEGMLAKYKKLYDINSDLAGWISIPGLEIDLPIAKAENNEYYLHRNIYKRYSDYGVTYFDYRMTDLKNLHRNNVVYGHNMRHDDLIFGNLENYRKIDYFRQNPVIECNTIYGDHTWFIVAVFMSNSRPAQDNGYVFPYNFVDVNDDKFISYLAEIRKRSFYDTGVDVDVSDKLLTLSTCCYDFNDARLVVVAREKRANESSNVDVSKSKVNPNPKYPQAWYDANGKTNPFVNDVKW